MGWDQFTIICLACAAGGARFVAILGNGIANDVVRIRHCLEVGQWPPASAKKEDSIGEQAPSSDESIEVS